MKDAIRVTLMAALIGLPLPGYVVAGETNASLEAGLGYSDNIGLTNGSATDQTLSSLGTIFDFSEDQGRLTGNLGGNLEYVHYFDDAFDDKLYGRVDLNGGFAFVPDTFSWMLKDSWGQNRRSDLFSPNPGNQENVNYLSTGPDLHVRFGSRMFMTVNGRYGATTYEKTPRDYTSLGGGLGLYRKLSETSTFGISAQAYRVEYDNQDFGTDYDAQEATLSYETKGARTSLGLEVGGSSLDQNSSTSSTPVFRLTLTRDVATASHLSLRAGQHYSNAGRVFSSGNFVPSGPGSNNPTDAVEAGDAIKETYGSIVWATKKPRTDWELGASYRKEQHEIRTELDRDVFSAYVRASHDLTQQLSMSGRVSFVREQYDNGLVDDDRLWANLSGQWSFSPKTYASLEWRYNNGNSNSVLRQYDENQYWLRAGYRLR